MSETGLRVKIIGDPVLRKTAVSVKQVTQAHRDILSEMAQVMYSDGGIGLAASQVGIRDAMLVVDIGSGLYKLINPKIVKKEGKQSNQEGCLSVPGVCIKVVRAKRVLIKGLDEFGKGISIEAEDLLACVFQHEIDHLKGKLIVDYASFLEKIRMKKRIEALKRKAKDERLSEQKEKSCKLQL